MPRPERLRVRVKRQAKIPLEGAAGNADLIQVPEGNRSDFEREALAVI